MKKVISMFSAVLVMMMFLSCKDKKEKEQMKKAENLAAIDSSPHKELVNNEKARKQLWKAAIDSGNCNAYSKIAEAYMFTNRSVECYYYSLIMANKYHCADAYLTMYTILTHQAFTDDMSILSNDKDTKNLAFYYLFKAKELGSTEAKELIDLESNKDKSSKNSSFFLKQLMSPIQARE